MSRRSLNTDDKLISEMMLDSISNASHMNIDMSTIFNAEQMTLMATYKEMYSFEPYLSFSLTLALMSHCSQGSYYTHFANSDHRPLQLYLWLLGPSGSGKTHAFRQLEKAILKLEKQFPEAYLKPVLVNGKLSESDQSSIISHTNHIGLRQHLSSNHKILLNDDADIIAESYGLYNVNDFTKEHERNLILCGFDGFNNSSRSTGTTLIQIDDKRLTIAIGTTGGKLMKNLKNFINLTGFDGSYNRFIYLSMRKLAYSRPQNFVVNTYSTNKPSLAHVALVAHLFGKVRYVFQMSEAERTKFFGATFPSSLVINDEDQSQQQQRSAMFTVWNIVADLDEMQDSKENEQQQITDLYAKAGTIFPRLVCLFQLYKNACEIFEKLADSINFAEGDNQDLYINETFINNVKKIIEKDYFKHDKTYLKPMELNFTNDDPMILVEKETVLTAWKWYEHHLKITVRLFTIDYKFTSKTSTIPMWIKPQEKSLKQLIMMFEFNCFPVSAITVKHPVTGKTGIIKNYPAFGEQALQELMKDDLIKFNFFLVDIRGRRLRSYLKTPVPNQNDPLIEKVSRNLLKHGINIDEYCSIYKNSSIPENNHFSDFGIQTLDSTSCLVTEYSKYKDQLNSVIKKRLDNQSIEEVENGKFIIKNASAFRNKFHEISNLSIEPSHEKINHKPLLSNTRNPTITCQTANPTINLTNRLTTDVAGFVNESEDIRRMEQQESTNILDHVETVEKNNSPHVEEEHEFSNNHNLSGNMSAKSDSAGTISATSTQQAIKEITNISQDDEETGIKKAMINIMTSKSVIFTKTDLTRICTNTPIRKEAINRLIAVGLLQHGNNYWVEPNRPKKNSKKELKRLIREGWIKKGPESDSAVSKFNFIKVLQEYLNISYDDYLKNFYPERRENVYTGNTWFLSSEVIHIFNTNFFYINHVKWNIERFQCGRIIQDEVNEDELPLTEAERSSNSNQEMTNENSKDMYEQSDLNHNRNEGTTLSTCVTSKRKAGATEHSQELKTRTQPKRTKKMKD